MSDVPPPPAGPPPPPPAGPLPPAASAPSGPLDVGTWLTDTTRTMVHGFGEFFAVLTVVSLLATAIAAPLLWVGSRDLVLVREAGAVGFSAVEGFTGSRGLLVGAGLVVLLVGQLLLFAGATVHTDRVRRGESPRWQETIGALVRRGPRVVAVVIQVVVLAFVLLIVSGVFVVVGLGPIATLVGFAAVAWLWIRCAVASTHAALGEPGASVMASFRWTRGMVWPLLGRHVLLVTLVFGVLLIASFVAAPFQSLGGAETLTDGDVAVSDIIGQSVAAFAAVQFINALASGVSAALWASAMLSLFRGEPVEA